MKPRFRRTLYPSGGFVVTTPQGAVVSGGDFSDLVRKTAASMSVSTDEAEAFVDAKLCAVHPAYCDNGPSPLPPGRPDTGSLASLQLGRVLSSSFTPVSEEQARNRLAICKSCPQNRGLSTPGCCGNKTTVEGLAKEVSRRYAIPGVFDSGWCGATGVNVKVASRLLLPEIQATDVVYPSLPENCFLRASGAVEGTDPS